MGSFFEKLKRGMGIEWSIEEEVEKEVEKKVKKAKVPRPKKLAIKTETIMEKVEEPEVKPVPSAETPTKEKVKEKREEWFEQEGQLAIDIYQTENELVIQSAIAGVKPEFLDISLERDIITIKGKREKPIEEGGNYFIQECYWGPFSREVILPVEIDPNRVEATMREGILTIRLPKIEREKKRKISIKSE